MAAELAQKPFEAYAHLVSEVQAPAAASLARRISALPPQERARQLVAALLDGEPIELAGADLRGLDLGPYQQGAATLVLDGADFSGAMLSGAVLAQASLRGACFDGALLVGADLSGADLSGASLRAAQLTGADLSRADLSHADLRGASLLTANLSDVTASGVVLREALLQSAMLERALLRQADLRWAHLVGSCLAGADLAGARFEGAVLLMANLTGAQLSRSTDFSYAFLYHARLDRSELSRMHLAGGIGEDFTDLGLARDTWRMLKEQFRRDGRLADARWAHRKLHGAATATHRPDRARRFHRLPPARGGTGRRLGSLVAGLERLCFQPIHGLRWLLGQAADIGTGYGTSFPRMGLTLLAVWLGFALVYGLAGAVIHTHGLPVSWIDLLSFSAATLTPIDAYPLATTSALGRTAMLVESVMGIGLLGALGHMVALRLNAD
ncbi:MAG: pentapeptide repeat-containing protein [Chloroflexi bacterium]|nr:pentapeptide repeat-containing protein [Chloroflexota bacterium]